MSTNDRLLRLPQVLEIIPISKTNFYEGMKRGAYPPPIKHGARASFWRMSDILRIVEGGTEKPPVEAPVKPHPKRVQVGSHP